MTPFVDTHHHLWDPSVSPCRRHQSATRQVNIWPVASIPNHGLQRKPPCDGQPPEHT